MKVNTGKTNMLCVLDAMTFRARRFIESEDGSRISSGTTDTVKILGFHFGHQTNVSEHIKALCRRFTPGGGSSNISGITVSTRKSLQGPIRRWSGQFLTIAALCIIPS